MSEDAGIEPRTVQRFHWQSDRDGRSMAIDSSTPINAQLFMFLLCERTGGTERPRPQDQGRQGQEAQAGYQII